MPFPIGAVVAGGLGLVTGVVQGNQQRQAAQDANELAEKQAEQRFERAEAEWAIDYEQKITRYLFDVAQLEAQKYSERQAKADYEARQSQLIDSALTNMKVNREALIDRFGTEEQLRATQVGLELDYNNATLAATAMDQISQYMTRVQQRTLQAQQIVQASNADTQDLAAQATLGFMQDALERDINAVARVVGAASSRASASQRQGGGSSAKRLALNDLQALGRTYGQIAMNNQARQSQIGLLNSRISGERATEIARYALESQGDINRMNTAKEGYGRQAQYNMDVFRELTIPSFELARRQGDRELQSLAIETQGRINQASQPFRESIFFDPLEPIAGLRPEYYAPTKVYEPTGLDIGLNAVSQGVNSAMQFSYQKPGGGIGFF